MGSAMSGTVNAARLFGGFDGVGAHAFQVHAIDDRAAGDDRLDARDAEFGRLLHDVIERRFLDRCEQKPEVRDARLQARLRFDLTT